MNELEKLKPEVRGAFVVLARAGIKNDALWVEAFNIIHVELVRLAEIEANAVGDREDADFWKERAERAESELTALKRRVDGYVVTLADKSHPPGLRYVMAYNERETADVLMKNDRHNKGLSVRAFRLLDDGESA